MHLNITDTALKVSQSLYCFTTSISHGVENYFPRLCLWGMGISDAIFDPCIPCAVRAASASSGIKLVGVPQPNLLHGFSPNVQDMLNLRGSRAD